jgi:hypothetical protein
VRLLVEARVACLLVITENPPVIIKFLFVVVLDLDLMIMALDLSYDPAGHSVVVLSDNIVGWRMCAFKRPLT